MKNIFFAFIFLLLFIFSSCQSQTTTKQNIDSTQSAKAQTSQMPNFNYTVEIPNDWTIRDTILNSLKVRLILSSQSLIADFPAANILIASMQGRDITDFTTRNINNLKSNTPAVVILERGNIDSTIYNGQWFTYTTVQNGIVRDNIIYIIPLDGFAYMITCGSNNGSINKYRDTFEKIAKSFRG